jgi:hypothetical protein
MDLELAGNVAAVGDDGMGGKEEAVGNGTVGHSFYNTYYYLFLAYTEYLLLARFGGILYLLGIELFQCMPDFVARIVNSQLVIGKAKNRFIRQVVYVG